jgi:NADH:ubiquinone oxidoreductase subunit F (NADH-binding)
MPTIGELQAQAAEAKRRIEARDRSRLAVCIDTSSIAVGAVETLEALRAEVSRRGVDVVVDQVGGNGMSFANPVVELSRPDGAHIFYQHVTAADVPGFVDALAAGNANNDWLLGALNAPEGDHLKPMSDYGWWTIQTRRLMENMGIIDPENLDEAIATGAYAGLDKALGMGQEELIAEVTGSKLGGRGGSYFPTGRKWDLLRTSPTEPKAMVCNADEGDGGAWVNRMTLESDPHSLIEGMMIGGWATGAARGYIYIREEYPLAFERVQKAVDQATERGILGTNIFGKNFEFEIKVVRGAGSYVCGEESGLIASIEDSRGMPKIRPPFPAGSGVFGQGSNVNNVQSYHTAAYLLRNGMEKWASVGTERNLGSMMFTLSGAVQRVGCFELPFGTKVGAMYEVCGGGAPEGHSFKATQVGGPLTGVMPAFSLDLGMEPEVFRENKMGTLGGGGFVFLDDTDCIVDLCAHFEWFLEDESCGRCTTCHGGSQRMVEILRRIQKGGGRESDIGKFRLLADTLRYSNCVHGQATPAIIVNMLDWFVEELNEHIYNKRCPAQTCKGLITYDVDQAAAPDHMEALAKAYDYCPTGAVKLIEGQYVIEDALCIRCDACRQIAPEAIRKLPLFEAAAGPAAELISVQPAYE